MDQSQIIGKLIMVLRVLKHFFSGLFQMIIWNTLTVENIIDFQWIYNIFN